MKTIAVEIGQAQEIQTEVEPAETSQQARWKDLAYRTGYLQGLRQNFHSKAKLPQLYKTDQKIPQDLF